MSNNQKYRRYETLKTLALTVVSGIGGFWGRVAGLFLTYLFNWMAKKGVYVINVGSSYIETNMDKAAWERVATSSWELKDKIDAGLKISDDEIKERSNAFRSSFRKFAVYRRVRS